VSEVTCPTCGTVAQLDEINRDAEAFCRVCDYPLFWIRSAGFGEGEGGVIGDPGLRRLPGTAGLRTVATFPCWNCDEPNPLNGVDCIRCGLDLHPAPVVATPPPPPPDPEPLPEPEPPPPPKRPLIPLAWVPALIAATLLLLLCIIGAVVAVTR
jgi:hypothetical protein